MYRVKVLETPIESRSQLEMEKALSYLRKKDYIPTIRQMLIGMFDSLKLPQAREELLSKMLGQTERYHYRPVRLEGALGDVFFRGDTVFILDQPEPGSMQAAIINANGHQEELVEFCKLVEEAIKATSSEKHAKGLEVSWTTPVKRRMYRSAMYPFSEGSFDDPSGLNVEQAKSKNPEYDSDKINAANFLRDTGARQLLLKLAQVSKIMGSDAAELVKSPEILNRLLSLGLMAEEYLLKCKQDQHTICTVASKNFLERGDMSHLRCSTCGRPFSEENVQNVYTITSRGKSLLSASLWMSIWITELLINAGVEKDRVKWGLEAGGDELDIMVDDFGSLLFLELKDREFGLGDAYTFAYRVSRYGGSLGMVLAMDKVSQDAKRFFEEHKHRDSTISIRCSEGQNGIEGDIPRIVNEMASAQVRRLLLPISVKAGFDLWPFVQAWMSRNKK